MKRQRASQIIIGDCRSALQHLPARSVHCCVTSPPYFGLRDYGCDGQIGLEATPDDYVAELVAVFREVRRVLRSDGTLWLNLGDSYAGGKTGRADADTIRLVDAKSGRRKNASYYGDNDRGGMQQRKPPPGVHAKQRLMIPARVALALQADGWWLRDEIIWHKPNPMPVSVTDRTTPAHEMLYMFAKSSMYYYDMEAVKEASGPNDRNGHSQWETGLKDTTTTRQPRSVWSITPKPFKGAHFATFPPDLIEPCIRAGCPEGGTVLDPFGGAGTVALVAKRLGRRSITVELNPAYAKMAERRIAAG